MKVLKQFLIWLAVCVLLGAVTYGYYLSNQDTDAIHERNLERFLDRRAGDQYQVISVTPVSYSGRLRRFVIKERHVPSGEMIQYDVHSVAGPFNSYAEADYGLGR